MELWLKFRRRMTLVISHSGFSLLPQAGMVLASLLVVRLVSVELWGKFVYSLIVLNLGAMVISWGHRELVLREFSRRPGRVTDIWQSNLASRAPLLLFFALIVMFLPGLESPEKLLLVAWAGAGFFSKAFDVLVIYFRKYRLAIIVEIAVLLALLAALWTSRGQLNVSLLLAIFAATTTLRGLLLAAAFREHFLTPLQGRFNREFLGSGLAFFLPGFLGYLQSRTDLYCLAFFRPESELGIYQILLTFLAFLQGLAALMLGPFLKNIFRLETASVKRLQVRLTLLGALLLAPAMAAVYAVISHGYQIALPLTMFSLGYLYVLPIYVYLPAIYRLMSVEKQFRVAGISLAGALLNLLLNLLLIPRMGMPGALLATTVTQWCLLAAFIIAQRRSQFLPVSPQTVLDDE